VALKIEDVKVGDLVDFASWGRLEVLGVGEDCLASWRLAPTLRPVPTEWDDEYGEWLCKGCREETAC
jgi:hypothetical protein